MTVSRGKQFEQVVKESFEKVEGCSIDRLHDQTTGYLGSSNICDFIVYKQPHQFYIECKTIHGNTFPLSNLTDKQYQGLSEKAKIRGVIAGVLCWWVDKDVTRFIPIDTIQTLKANKFKSIRFDMTQLSTIEIKGKKKRVFFDYDMEKFLKQAEYDYRVSRKERSMMYAGIKFGGK